MVLLFVWGFVALYFLVLLYAVGLEMAVAGSIIFVLWAFKVTVTALMPLSGGHRATSHPLGPQPGLPANQNQPPQ